MKKCQEIVNMKCFILKDITEYISIKIEDINFLKKFLFKSKLVKLLKFFGKSDYFKAAKLRDCVVS